MDDLILRVLTGEGREEDRRTLDEWRKASLANERHYQETVEVWRLTAPAGTELHRSSPPSVAAIVEEAERRRAQVILLMKRRRRRMAVWGWSAAAAIALAVGIGRVRWVRLDTRDVASTPGQGRTVVLADGSVVRLSPGSSLTMRDAAPREVLLHGGAFLAVAPDSARPFVVRMDAGDVRVLGTRFALRSDADSVRVVVVDGRVRLTGTGGTVDVTRGQVGRIVGRTRPSVTEVPNVWALLDLPPSVMLFRDTPLVDVLREVGARYERPVVLRDSSLARLLVTATFDADPLVVVVNTVCAVVGARCVVGDTVFVAR